ncbi:MAG: enoyl-CoA hydratase-related protein [Planctomycetota bacterium]
MSELVRVRDEGFVRWLTLNRPDVRNALSAGLVAALQAALAEAETADVRCIALTGEGTVFSAGADLKALEAMQSASYEENLADSQRLADLFRCIALHPLPVVAAVNGHAIAGGAGLALACDVAFVAPEAKIGFTEVRIGFVPAIILNFLLRTAGEKVLRDLCLTGRRITGAEAARLGLVNEAVEPERLAARVAAFGDEVKQASPEAIAATKRLLLDLRSRPLDDGLASAAEANARARATTDCREGIAAFLQKRKPNWNLGEEQ